MIKPTFEIVIYSLGTLCRSTIPYVLIPKQDSSKQIHTYQLWHQPAGLTGGWRLSLHAYSSQNTTSPMKMGAAPVPPTLPSNGTGPTRAATPPPRIDVDGPNRYVFSCLFVLRTLLFFSLFFFQLSLLPRSTMMSARYLATRSMSSYSEWQDI